MDPVAAAITAFSQGILDGDLGKAVSHFDLPMAIYAGDQVVVCADSARLATVFANFRDRLALSGAWTVEVRLLAVPLRRGPTGTAWAERVFRDRNGKVVETCRARYFFRYRHDAVRICMIDCLGTSAAATLSCLAPRRRFVA